MTRKAKAIAEAQARQAEYDNVLWEGIRRGRAQAEAEFKEKN